MVETARRQTSASHRRTLHWITRASTYPACIDPRRLLITQVEHAKKLGHRLEWSLVASWLCLSWPWSSPQSSASHSSTAKEVLSNGTRKPGNGRLRGRTRPDSRFPRGPPSELTKQAGRNPSVVAPPANDHGLGSADAELLGAGEVNSSRSITSDGWPSSRRWALPMIIPVN